MVLVIFFSCYSDRNILFEESGIKRRTTGYLSGDLLLSMNLVSVLLCCRHHVIFTYVLTRPGHMSSLSPPWSDRMAAGWERWCQYAHLHPLISLGTASCHEWLFWQSFFFFIELRAWQMSAPAEKFTVGLGKPLLQSCVPPTLSIIWICSRKTWKKTLSRWNNFSLMHTMMPRWNSRGQCAETTVS